MSIKELSDQVLLARCSKDDIQAYEVLFDKYTPRLYRFALKYISERETVEELVMDLMLWIWQNRHCLDVERDFGSYIFKAMRNAVISHLRKKVLATSPLDLLAETLEHASAPADQELQYQETEALYLQKLALLSPQRQKVFRMSREENMSYKEIASSLNLSVNTVENYMSASLAFFRVHLKEYADLVNLVIVLLILI